MNSLFSYLNTKVLLSHGLIDCVCVFFNSPAYCCKHSSAEFKLYSLQSFDLIQTHQCLTTLSRKNNYFSLEQNECKTEYCHNIYNNMLFYILIVAQGIIQAVNLMKFLIILSSQIFNDFLHTLCQLGNIFLHF